MTIEQLHDEINNYTQCETIHMYIVERKLKEGSKRKDKPSIKFEYIPMQVNLSKELIPVIQKMLEKVIEKKFKDDDIALSPYEVIDDSTNKVLTYNDIDKISGFKEFLSTKLNGEINTLDSLEELIEIEKAWALCYGFYNEDLNKWLYCIKKLAPKSMVVDAEFSTSVNDAIKKGFTSLFDTNTKTLKPFNGFSLNIQPSIDLVFVENEIYIFHKKGFEEITSLTEEFEEYAREIVVEVNEMNIIETLDQIESMILKQPSMRNKLIKAKSIGNLEYLKRCKSVKTEFNKSGRRLNIKFKFDENGRLLVDNEDDAKNIINVLSEYFKEGVFAGKIFESASGRLRK